MKINIDNLLGLFDGDIYSEKGDISSIIGLLGEDLNSAVFKKYLEDKGKDIKILDLPVTQGFKKSKWLDRWIVNNTDKIIYQCEIKNWASTAIGGKKLSNKASFEEICSVSEYNRMRQMKTSFDPELDHPNGVSKVLDKMKVPEDYSKYKLRPLIIYWHPISFNLEDLSNPYSVLDIDGVGDFSSLESFSVSLYLRTLNKDIIDIKLKNLDRRLQLLGNIIEESLK